MCKINENHLNGATNFLIKSEDFQKGKDRKTGDQPFLRAFQAIEYLHDLKFAELSLVS